jgi:hypothetical protein
MPAGGLIKAPNMTAATLSHCAIPLPLPKHGLRCPGLLILDEATSAIDIAGEREVIYRA